MKKAYLLFIATGFITGMSLLNSCKKDTADNTDVATLNEEQAGDSEDVTAATDAVDDDIDNVVSSSSLKSASALVLPCNATADSSLLVNKKCTINFNGDNCNGTRTRTGKVEITLTSGTKWSDEGAVLTVKYTDLKIVRKATQKYITLNGTKTHTNVSGGLLKNLGLVGTPTVIVRKTESNSMSVTFTNGTTRTWNIARTRSFSKVGNYYTITISGFGVADGKTSLETWGTNRRNTAFYTEINSPIVMSQECDYNPSSGEKTHYVGNRVIDTTLGTDSNGNPVTSGCADYFRISWTGIGGTKTAVLPY